MKRTVVIIAGAMALIGCVMLCVGMLFGGSPLYSIDAENYTVYRGEEQCVEETRDLDDFTAIDMDIDAADITIKYGDSYHVHYVLEKRLVPSMEVKNGTLKVKSLDEGWHVGFGFVGWNGADQFIEITVPKDVKLTDVTLHNDAGNINLSDVEAENVNIRDSAGDIECENIKTDGFTVDNDAGDVDLTNITAKNLKADVDAGDLKFKNVVADRIEMSSDAGGIKGDFGMSLKDYTIDVTCDFGDVKIDGANQGEEYHVKGDSDKTLTIDCSAGDIKVNGK